MDLSICYFYGFILFTIIIKLKVYLYDYHLKKKSISLFYVHTFNSLHIIYFYHTLLPCKLYIPI